MQRSAEGIVGEETGLVDPRRPHTPKARTVPLLERGKWRGE